MTRSNIAKAEEAVCRAVERRLDHAHEQADGKGVADPEIITKCAHAVAELKYGPQGGRYTSAADDKTDYRYRSDAHSTSHQGEDRERPSPGFSS